jgi:O-antigen ligase
VILYLKVNNLTQIPGLKDLLNKDKLSYVFALLSVIVMPIYVDYLPPLMILWFLSRVLENLYRKENFIKVERTYLYLFILVILFFLWQVTGLFYSDDTHMAWLNIFSRLSLVLFPVVLLNPGTEVKSKAPLLIKIFAFSTFLYLVFCFGYAFFRSVSFTTGQLIFNPVPPDYKWLNYFFGSDLTIWHHPTYVAMYVLFSVIAALESFFDTNLKLKFRMLWLFLSVFLLASLYFLSSRSAILAGIVLISFYIVVKLNDLGKKTLLWLWIFLMLIIVAPFLISVVNHKQNNINTFFFSQQASNKAERDPRNVIWRSSLEVAENNLLLGLGIGDVRTELTKEYLRIGQTNMAKVRLNAHNQFLEILLESGIIGLTFFAGFFAYMIFVAINKRNLLYGSFLLMMLMFFMFESVLYRLAGMTFFSLFSFLLLLYDNKSEKINTI